MSPLPLLQLRCLQKVNSDPAHHHSTCPSPTSSPAPSAVPMCSTSPSSPQVKLTSLCAAAIAVVVIVMVLLRMQFDWYKTRPLLIWRRFPISCVSLLVQSLGAQIKDELRSVCGPPDTQGGPNPLPTQVGAPLFIAVIFAHPTSHSHPPHRPSPTHHTTHPPHH